MQSNALSGVVLAHLASCVTTQCSISALKLIGSRGLASVASSTTGAGEHPPTPTGLPSLSAAQRQQLPGLLALLRRPGDVAQRLGGLTSLAASYRDLAICQSALQMRHHDLDPLVDSPADLASQLKLAQADTAAGAPSTAAGPSPSTSSAAGAAAAAVAGPRAAAAPRRGSFLPLKDVSALPEDVAVDGRSEAPAEPQYHPPYMDKISCWSAMQPSHLEMSQPLMTAIKLFPPVEAAYPTYVDFDAAQRMLANHTSRKRLRLQRRLLRKQDKYQIKTWDHYSGEA